MDKERWRDYEGPGVQYEDEIKENYYDGVKDEPELYPQGHEREGWLKPRKIIMRSMGGGGGGGGGEEERKIFFSGRVLVHFMSYKSMVREMALEKAAKAAANKDKEQGGGDDSEAEEVASSSTSKKKSKRDLNPNNQKGFAADYMSGYKSSIKYCFEVCNVFWDAVRNDAEFRNWLFGYKKQVAKWKLAGDMRMQEGKSELPIRGYGILNLALLKMTPQVEVRELDDMRENGKSKRKQVVHTHTDKEAIFGHAMLTLQWNDTGRAGSTAGLNLKDISWEEDSLKTDACKSKTDQDGEKNYVKRVYANPLNPAICAVLALAIYLFCLASGFLGSQNNRDPRLFSGGNQENRFGKILARAIDGLGDTAKLLLGAIREDLGTHSIRKGVTSYVLGIIEGPSPVALCLRALWSLGDVHNRYMFATGGADQFVGRTVAGLPSHEAAFATLPPHFTLETSNAITEADEWDDIYPGFSSLPDGLKQVVPFLAASIIYHQDWLAETLHAQHPLFSTPIYVRGYVRKYAGKVLTGVYKCPNTGMEATGVPPTVKQSIEMQELKASFAQILVQQDTRIAAAENSLTSQLRELHTGKIHTYTCLLKKKR